MDFAEILKKDWVLRTWNIFKDWNFYPYSIKYVWEDDSGDWSIFYIKFLYIDQEFLEEDIEEVFKNDVYDVIDDFLKDLEKKKEKQSLTVRFFKQDLDFLKSYAKKNSISYQSLIRDAVDKYVSELKN